MNSLDALRLAAGYAAVALVVAVVAWRRAHRAKKGPR